MNEIVVVFGGLALGHERARRPACKASASSLLFAPVDRLRSPLNTAGTFSVPGGDVNEQRRMAAITRERKHMSRTGWRISIAALAAATLAVTVVVSGAQARPAKATRATNVAFEVDVVANINAVRARYGLRPLRLSYHLEQSARNHSQQMAALGYFSHSSKDGTSYVERIKRHFTKRGFRFWAVGENLLWVSSGMTAQQVVDSWLASPQHRAVLLSRLWRVVGVGVANSSGGCGVYPGGSVELVTADFGVRR
jgi:uncharacterized protein YkwD